MRVSVLNISPAPVKNVGKCGFGIKTGVLPFFF